MAFLYLSSAGTPIFWEPSTLNPQRDCSDNVRITGAIRSIVPALATAVYAIGVRHRIVWGHPSSNP